MTPENCTLAWNSLLVAAVLPTGAGAALPAAAAAWHPARLVPWLFPENPPHCEQQPQLLPALPVLQTDDLTGAMTCALPGCLPAPPARLKHGIRHVHNYSMFRYQRSCNLPLVQYAWTCKGIPSDVLRAGRGNSSLHIGPRQCRQLRCAQLAPTSLRSSSPSRNRSNVLKTQCLEIIQFLWNWRHLAEASWVGLSCGRRRFSRVSQKGLRYGTRVVSTL